MSNFKQPKAKRSRNKDLIKVEGCLDARSTPPITLKITATPEDWDALHDYLVESSFIKDNPERVISEILAFTDSALKAMEKTKPRGKHLHTNNLVDEIKEKAGFLYPFFKYWCKKPLESWPAPLKRVLEMAVNEVPEEMLRLKDGYDPKVLTAYCINKVCGERAKEAGLKRLFEYEVRDSFDNFYYTNHGRN